MTELDKQEKKFLHESIDLAVENCWLQIEGVDVAIPYIQGIPGGGKTSSIYDEVSGLGGHVLSTHFALKMLEELGGIPQFDDVFVNGEKRIGTEWSFPDIMKTLFLLSDQATVSEKGGVLVKSNMTGRILSAHPKVKAKDVEFDSSWQELEEIKGDGKIKPVIWLLDDMHLCGPVHMALLYELLTERKLREYHLPKNVGIILCGNTSQKAGAKVTLSAIVNRCYIMPVQTDFMHWKNNFALEYGVHPAVISFLGNQSYQKFFHEAEEVDKPWASPRAWTRLSTMMNRIEEKRGGKKIASDDLSYLAQGHVGKNAAGELLSYYKIFSKFNMKKIFEEYKSFKIPSEPVEQYAMAYAIITEYCGVDDAVRKKLKYPAKLAHFVNEFRTAKNNVSELGMMMLKELSSIENSTGKQVLKEAMTEVVKIDPSLIHQMSDDIITHGK